MIDRTNRNGLSSYSMAKQEFEEEFLQRSPRACAAENGWPSGVIYHFVSNSGLTLRTHKRELQYLHTVWGVGVCIFLLSLFFFFISAEFSFSCFVFLTEALVLPHPFVHLTLLFGWWLPTCHPTLLTVERVTPMSLLHGVQSAAGAGKAKHVNISCI